MVECLFILYILLLFIFPIPGLMLTLGTLTSYLIYKKFLLLQNQPAAGKRVARLALVCGGINFTISILLGLVLAFGVYFAITDLFFILAFNFLFCTLISMRWFDFAHGVFRMFIYRFKELDSPPRAEDPEKPFVMILGLRKSTGWGRGLVPVFMDAGNLHIQEDRLVFDGVYLNLTLTSHLIKLAEPVSYERIRFVLNRPILPYPAEAFWLIVRDQFYPFKSRDTRDRLLTELGFPIPKKSQREAPAPLPSPGPHAS